MKFIDNIAKQWEKDGITVGESEPPRYWVSTGNHVLNKTISGSFHRGIPQGRMICFTGPSQSGKSFLLCNTMREAQKAGCFVVAIDTEHALDDDFVSSIGVDVKDEDKYRYVEADTITEIRKVMSTLIKGYKKEYGNDPKAPKLFIAIDSLDMMLTETEQENFDKGTFKGDMGQRNKQLKAMQREFVQNMKHFNISIATTAQVYKNQDLTNGEGNWIVADAIKYAPSQIVLLTKLKLKDNTTADVHGIRMICEGYKTRFTKPFQKVTIEVPYEEGMDPYNGLFKVAHELDVVQQKGSWVNFGDHKWQGKKVPAEHAQAVLDACEAHREQFLEAILEENEELDLTDGGPRPTAKRKAKATKKDD